MKKLTDKEYDVIYADPPWKYNFSPSKRLSVDNYYPTMKLEDIKNLPIKSKKNSVLYLWATSAKLLEALEVMESWGFTYKTHMVWDKNCRGMGYWSLGQHELLLIGTKGKFSPPAPKYIVSSIYLEKRPAANKLKSRKPSYFRDLITRAFYELDKIELFATENVDGWDCYGIEVD